MWELGIKARSPGRAASTPNHRAISVAPNDWKIFISAQRTFVYIKFRHLCCAQSMGGHAWAIAHMEIRGQLLGMGSPRAHSPFPWELNSNLAARCLTTEAPCQSCFSISERQLCRMFLPFFPLQFLEYITSLSCLVGLLLRNLLIAVLIFFICVRFLVSFCFWDFFFSFVFELW